MNNTKLILVALLVSTISFAQINIIGELKQNALNTQSPFLDAASNGSSVANQGKGLLFPRTDLTKFTMAPATNGSSFTAASNPNGFDGMIVYNTATGTTAMGGSVQITPGYYYYRNTTAGTASPDINGGTWIRISDPATIAASPKAFENDATSTLAKLTATSASNNPRATGTEFVIKDNGNVGIGVADPQEALDIAGGVRLTDTIVASRAVISSIRIPNKTPGKGNVLATDALGNLSWTAGPSSLTDENDHIGKDDLALSANRTLTTDSYNLKFEGTTGDVDINDGTLTAVSLTTTNLKVNTTNTADQVLTAKSTDGSVEWANLPKAGLFENDNTKTLVKLTNQSDGTTARTGTDQFVIKDDGKVGVGTDDPKHQLDVVGNVKTTDTLFTKLIKITGGSPGVDKILTSDAMGNAVWRDITDENYIKDITINYSASTGFALLQNLKIFQADGTLYPNQSEWEVEAFSFDASKVGENLGQPSTKYNISSGATATLKIKYIGKISTTGFAGIQASTRDDNPTLRINSITLTYTGAAPPDVIPYKRTYTSPSRNALVDMKTTAISLENNIAKFVDGTNPQDAVFTAGRVGIATDSPTKTLDVMGSTKASDTLFAKNLQLLTANTPVADQILTVLDDKGNVAWKTMAAFAASWELKGNAATDITTDFVGTTDDKELNIRTNNVERVKITTDNRLLLNVETPWSDTPGGSNTIGLNSAGQNNQRLRITSGSQDTQSGAQGASIDLFGNNTLINAGRLDLVPGSSAAAGAPAINFYGNDGTSQVQAMTMLGNGNLGIGFVPAAPPSTPSQPHMPTEKLDVLGNIKSSDTLITTGIKITGGTTPPTDGQVLTAVGTTGKGQWKDDDVNNLLKDQDFGLITQWSGKLVSGQRTSGSKASANTFLGIDSGSEITTGRFNTAVGASALSKNTTGELNNAVGVNALQNNTTGRTNIAVGANALMNNTTGNNNVSIGSALTNSNNNATVGVEAIDKVVGDDNVAMGYQAGLYDNQTGTNNLTAGSKSVYIGNKTRGVNSATNQIVIGNEAIGKGSNSVVLGNEAIRNTYLRGAVHLDTLALSTAPADGNILTADGTTGKVKWASAPAAKLFQQIPADQLIRLNEQSDGSPRATGTELVIDDDGHVGVGIAKPNQTLSLRTKANATTDDGILMLGNANTTVLNLYESRGNAGGVLDLHGQSGVKTRIAAVNNTPNYINNGGNFGVGLNDPKEKLDVKGNVQSSDSIKAPNFQMSGFSPAKDKVLVAIDNEGHTAWKDLLADDSDIETVEVVYQAVGGGAQFNDLKILRADGGLYGNQSEWKIIEATRNTSQVGRTLDQTTSLGTGPGGVWRVKVEHKKGVPTLGFGGIQAKLNANTTFQLNEFNITYTGSRADKKIVFGVRYGSSTPDQIRKIVLGNPVPELSITKFVNAIDPKDAAYSGKVGIGTYTPTESLDVVGGNIKTSDTLITKGFRLTRNATIAGQLLTATGSTGEGYFQNLQGVFAHNTTGKRAEVRIQSDNKTARVTGTEFVIKDDGKVGIGTTNPTHLLDVAGHMKIKDTLETSLIKMTGGSPGLGKVLTSDTDGNASWTNVLTDAAADIESFSVSYGPSGGGYQFDDVRVLSANGSLYPDQSQWEITQASIRTSEVGKTLDQSTFLGGGNTQNGYITVTYNGTDRTVGFGGIRVTILESGVARINTMTIRYKGGVIPDKVLRFPGRVRSAPGTGRGPTDIPVTQSLDETVVGNGISKFVDGTSKLDAAYVYGKVGIGTYAPTAALDVEGDARVATILKVGERVGIGTNDPKAPLHVARSENYANEVYDATSIDKAVAGLQEDQGTTSAKLTMDISAYFESNVISAQKVISASADSFSDARVKDIVGISDSEEDLELLNKIKITNYTKKDTLALGKKISKKVIAQQVEKVFPQVVSKMSRTIPDIYKNTTEVVYANRQLTVSCPQDLKTGDRVKVMVFIKGKKGAKQMTTAVLSADANSFVIYTDEAIKGEIDNVFVYGREVDDFRVVDYDGISMLNVSATQKLYDEIQQLEEDKKQLKSKMEILKKKTFSDEEAKSLRSMMEALSAED